MLNYILIDQYEKFGIDHIFFVDWESVNSFLCSYATEPSANGRFRSRATIERCVNNVADFIRRLKYKYDGYVQMSPDELFEKKTARNRHGQDIVKRVPLFQVKHIPQHNETFRELPPTAFQILLNLALRYAPDIAQIQYWRGDKSPESAFAYLQNKGDLIRELESTSELLFDILMDEGAKRLGK
jgi:hypothetical protein